MASATTYSVFHLMRGWSIIALAVACAGMGVFVWWRRFWLGCLAIFSLVLAAFVLALLPTTWAVARSVSLAWSVGTSGVYDFGVGSSHGTLMCSLAVATGGNPIPWPGQLIVLRDPNYGRYLFKRDNITSISPFVEDKIGLQIGHQRTEWPSLRSIENEYTVVMPHWLFVLLFCPWFPLAWYLRRRRRLRQRGFPISSPQATPRAHPPS